MIARMNLRQAAALALGWYLMTAPIKNIGSFSSVEKKAPISKWSRQEQFDTKEHCETARAEYLAYPPMPLREVQDLLAAECVATDDPRLKE
jgi:hypothetical protein